MVSFKVSFKESFMVSFKVSFMVPITPSIVPITPSIVSFTSSPSSSHTHSDAHCANTLRNATRADTGVFASISPASASTAGIASDHGRLLTTPSTSPAVLPARIALSPRRSSANRKKRAKAGFPRITSWSSRAPLTSTRHTAESPNSSGSMKLPSNQHVGIIPSTPRGRSWGSSDPPDCL